MIKKQIKGFDILVSDEVISGCNTPLSYPSQSGLLDEKGACYADNITKYTPFERATLRAGFEVSEFLLSFNNVHLVLERIGAPATVKINGHTVGVTKQHNLTYDFDVKNYLHIGENSISIELDASDFTPTEYCISGLSLGSCELVGYNYSLVGNICVKQEFLDRVVRLHISLDSFDKASGVRAVATLVSPGGRVYFCGMLGGCGTIDISEPNLWWPCGLGVQNLYKLTVNLYYDNEIIDSRDVKIGLVNYSADMEKQIPVLSVNGISQFSRGACYLPDSAVLPMLDDERTRHFVAMAKELHFNTIVIRDFGVYPTDLFYTLCDQAGITVWHEVRCDTNRDDKIRELENNLVPRAFHPSFALLLYTNGTPCEKIRSVLPDKCSFVLGSLDEIVTEPSPSLPQLTSLKKFVPPYDMNIFGKTLEVHSTIEDNSAIFSSSYYKCPRGISEQSYATALMARDKIEQKINILRRSGTCQRHLILDRFCDTVPTISPSVLDAFGRVKGVGFGVRDLFSDVYLGAVNQETRVTFFVSNETKNEYNGRFEYVVYHSTGTILFRDGFDITSMPLSSFDILTVDLDEAVGERLDECFVYYRLSDSFITTSCGTLFFVPSKRFKYSEPNIKRELSGSGRDFVLTVSSTEYAGRVYLEFTDTDAAFSDNLFDIAPGGAVSVKIKTEHAVAIEVLRRELKVRTLFDLGRD